MNAAGNGPQRVLAVWCPGWPADAGPGAGGAGPGAEEAGPGARAFERVVTVVEGFCPRVEVLRPGVCAINASGPARYFGGEESLARKIAEAVASHGFTCQVGIADGLFAARLAAQTGLSGLVVAAGRTPAFLAKHSVSTLDSPDLEDLLPRLGIWTLGEFAALPTAEAASRFGAQGARAHRLASGLDPRPLVPRPPSSDLSVQLEFDPPAEQAEPVVFAAKTLAERMHTGLAASGLACVRVQAQVICADGREITRLWRHDGFLSALAVAERVRWQLAGWQPDQGGNDQAENGNRDGRGGNDQAENGNRDGRGGNDQAENGNRDGQGGNGSGERGRGERGWNGRAERGRGERGRGERGRGEHGGQDANGRDASAQGGHRAAGEEIQIGGVTLLRLVPDQLVRDEGRQLGLWGDAVISDRVARAAIRVQAMLGHGAVVWPVLAGGRSPAEQVTLVPFGDVSAPLFPAGRPWPGQIPAPAPATVYPIPRPAVIADDRGVTVTVTGRGLISAPPAILSAGGGPSLAVISWAGPWPVTERWWDPANVRRCARFQLVTEDGNAWLVAMQDGRWLIEASYD